MPSSYAVYSVVSRLLGIILIAAGVLKLADLPSLAPSHPAVATTGSIWAILEIIGGSWLLAGLYPQATWWVTVVGFTTLLGLSLEKAAIGAKSCGCFGKAAVSPWVTVAIDSAA